MISRVNRNAWLINKLQDTSGDSVQIRRGGRTSPAITGVLTIREYEVIDETDGIPTLVRFADWLFKRSEILLAGEQVTLRPGDELVSTINSEERTFQVMPIGKKPCVEAIDGPGIMVVVHTKEITWQQC